MFPGRSTDRPRSNVPPEIGPPLRTKREPPETSVHLMQTSRGHPMPQEGPRRPLGIERVFKDGSADCDRWFHPLLRATTPITQRLTWRHRTAAPQPTPPVSQRTALGGRRSVCQTSTRNSQDEQPTAAAMLRLAGPTRQRPPDP